MRRQEGPTASCSQSSALPVLKSSRLLPTNPRRQQHSAIAFGKETAEAKTARKSDGNDRTSASSKLVVRATATKPDGNSRKPASEKPAALATAIETAPPQSNKHRRKRALDYFFPEKDRGRDEATNERGGGPKTPSALRLSNESDSDSDRPRPVSYTHLTLPTILLV